MVSAGVEAQTIQSFLEPSHNPNQKRPRMYFVDEATLADVHQGAAFLEKLKRGDRVMMVGDRRQHGSLGAGRIFADLQDAGMETLHLRKIVRQTNEAYRAEVKMLSQGRVSDALAGLDERGRIFEITSEGKRYAAIAKTVLEAHPRVLVVSPDNASLAGISEAIRQAKQEAGLVSKESLRTEVLIPRSDMGTADTQLAGNYRAGDVILYVQAGDKKLGIARGDYASVVSTDHERNALKVMKWSDGKVIEYDPAKSAARAPAVFEQQERHFAVGNRVQFTMQFKEFIAGPKGAHRITHAANRALGTIEGLDEAGNIGVRMDKDEKLIARNLESFNHISHGYTMTSYSSQSVTAPEVIVHIDTDAIGANRLLSQQLFYVAWSRGQQEATLFTNSRDELDGYLSRDVQNATALAPGEVAKYREVAAASVA